MPGAGIRISVEGVPEVSLGFGALVRRLADATPAMDEIGSSMVARTRQRFEEERGPDGAAWKPSQRARREGGKTLRDSNRLFQSLTHRAEPDAAEWGTNVEYAAIHQFGGRIRRAARSQVLAFDRRGRFRSRASARRRRRGVIPIAIASIGAGVTEMPARPYLGIDDADRGAILRIVHDWLDGAP